MDNRKTPWPWFGGKADVWEIVWEALGDVAHYVEPFAGSLAVLLRRPHPANRTYYSETVNDLDGFLALAGERCACTGPGARRCGTVPTAPIRGRSSGSPGGGPGGDDDPL